jgi:hypothetical protein
LTSRVLPLAVVIALLAGAICTSGAVRKSPLRGSLAGERRAFVWAVGDGDGSAAAIKVAKEIARGKPDLFLYLGDVYEQGTAAQFQANYRPAYARFSRITAPTPGNHEWPLHASGYDAYWRAVLKRPIAPYYRFTVAGWQIFSLNSEAPHDETSPQVAWLKAKLKARGTCRLAFWHRPRYGDGFEGTDEDVAPLWDALRGHAALVINGHDHNAQRYKPIDGITQLVEGAGGHGLHPISRPDPNRVYGDSSEYSALRLTLRRGRASYKFVAADGATLSSGAVRCQPG